jgi:hypothetical protein
MRRREGVAVLIGWRIICLLLSTSTILSSPEPGANPPATSSAARLQIIPVITPDYILKNIEPD